MSVIGNTLIVRELGIVNYGASLAAMQAFTAARTRTTPDELWLLEHPPVYTLGIKNKEHPFIPLHEIPLVHSDRGGAITYHGPGQVIAYLLIDLARRNLGVHMLVRTLEQAVIDLLAEYCITGKRRVGAPGVYVDNKKIAALGLRVRRGATYHGLALNVNMDIAPFRHIDPCGYPNLEVTQLSDLSEIRDCVTVGRLLVQQLQRRLGYTASAQDDRHVIYSEVLNTPINVYERP